MTTRWLVGVDCTSAVSAPDPSLRVGQGALIFCSPAPYEMTFATPSSARPAVIGPASAALSWERDLIRSLR
jgi:hypothetical protein